VIEFDEVKIYSRVMKANPDMAGEKRIGSDQTGKPICFLRVVLELPCLA